MGRSLGYSRCVAIGLTMLTFSLGGCFTSSSEEEAPKEVVSEEDASKTEITEDGGLQDEGLSSFNEDPLAAKDSGPLALQDATPLASAPPALVQEPAPMKDPVAEEKQRENLSGGDFGAAGVAAAVGLPEMGSKMVYIVKKGDTLGKISKKIFGKSKNWKHFTDWNTIVDVNRIYPGEVIYYQLSKDSVAFASRTEKEEEHIKVVVQKGQTLGSVAKKFYGSSTYWPLVWRQNAEIKHPDKLEAGSEIYLTLDKNLVVANNSLDVKKVSIKKDSGKSGNQFSMEKNVKQEKSSFVKVILENV